MLAKKSGCGLGTRKVLIMGHLEELLPLATAEIISPMAIAAIIAILLSPRAKKNGFAFAGATFLTTAVIVLIATFTTKGAGSDGSSHDDTIVLVLAAVLGILFTVLAIMSWHGRPKRGAVAKEPGWLAAVDSLQVGKAFALGLLMAATNSKNLPIDLKAGALIGAGGLELPLSIGLGLLFALVASLGVLLPTVLAATGSPTIARYLGEMKAELIAHNAVIMTVLFAMLAATEFAHVISVVSGGAF